MSSGKEIRRCKVYRQLDRSWTLFGVSGPFIGEALNGGGVALGAAALSQLLFGTFILTLAVAVGGVVFSFTRAAGIQRQYNSGGRPGERDYRKRNVRIRIPRYVHFGPGGLAAGFRGFVSKSD